ncbi:MAG: DNA-binding response regulator, partial [Alphaproteobacteria bacterium]|nr:DNA-binding response regulator [Alphaproteobacteria bacterium]
ARKAVAVARARTRIAVLSDRERQVFELLVSGRRSHEIAMALGISKRTIDVHRAAILRKLRAPGIAGLVRLALDAG